LLDRDQQNFLLLVPLLATPVAAKAMRYVVAREEKRKSMGHTAKAWGK